MVPFDPHRLADQTITMSEQLVCHVHARMTTEACP